MKKIIRLTESDLARIVKRIIKENKISSEKIEQELIDLANAERFLVDWGKPSHRENTSKITYTDLSDTTIKDDFTKYYDDMKTYLNSNDNMVVLNDFYNKRKFEFQLIDNILKITKIEKSNTFDD
jgi:hypothetical protein